KTQIDSLMAEFDAIKDKMSDQKITREEYDDLYSIYTDIWSEIVEQQKEQKKCIESTKKTIKVKVEPKKVDQALPQIFGAKWGSSRQSVKDKLRNAEGLKISDTDESVLEYKNGKHLGYAVNKWQFNFTNKKLYACQIVYSAHSKMNALKLYNEISSKLIKEYGEPSYEKNKFPSSYKDDKIKLSSIKNGSVTIYNKWLFKNDDVLRIGINENGDVMMTYLVEKLHNKAR
ncbi:MAG: hypothetical protein JXN63_05175, partial [Candidatus Delongbacteria bacterium]|nr:hypothetical protein [Candidatus Delongbacteria bacterium]